MNKVMRAVLGVRGFEEKDGKKLSELYKQLLIIAWPAALEGLLMSLMNSFDTMMVGKLGTTAISAVGLCGQPRMILLMIAQALCVGTTAVVARRKGANDQAAALSCMKQTLVIITAIGVLMTAAGYFFSDFLLGLGGAKEDTLPMARIYFRITCLAFVPNFWALCICAAMRGIGKTRITMTVNMTANIVNVCLNYCLIGGHFGFPALGVKGAAIATAVGTCVSSIMAIVMVLRPGYLCLRPFTKVEFDKQTLSSLFKVGSGAIVESVFMRIGFLINARLIAGVSTLAFAVNQIVMQVTSMTFTLSDGLASACTALIGQALGARKPDEAKLWVKIGMRVAMFLSIAMIVFIFFSRKWLPTLYSEDQAAIDAAALSFVVVIFGTYHQNMRVMYASCLRGAGDVKYVAIVSLISVAIARPLMTWLFAYPLNAAFPLLQLGYIGSWLGFVVDSLLRAVMFEVRIRKGEWVNIKL